MANSKKIPSKGPKVVTLEGAEAQENAGNEASVPAEFAQTPTPQEPEPRKPGKPGRPSKNKSFWESVNEISQADWQAKRFYIYAYLIEPFCNVRTEGEPGYLRKFYQGIDPEFFLNEWGSGKYFLRLKEKPPGQPKDRDVDMLTFEIYNPSHPPKLPRKLWENDPRNERWLAMLPKEQKPTSQAETMQILNAMFDMQDRIEERIKGGDDSEPSNGVSQVEAVLNTATKLVELTRPKESATAVDPWAAAEKIMTMRSENPMVTILQGQLATLTAQMEKRDERMSAMQNDLFEAKLNALKAQMQPAAAPKGILEQAKELAEALGIAPGDALKRFIGGNGEPVVRSRMSGNLELAETIITKVFDSPIPSALSNWLNSKATAQPREPVINVTPQNGHAPQQQPADPNQELFQFVNEHVTEKMIQALNDETDGDDFANAFFVMYPQHRLQQLQNITHPLMPGLKGAPVIIKLYQQAAGGQIWRDHLQRREAQFRKFVEDFCAWKPEGDATPAAMDTGEAGPRAEGGDF